MDDVVRAEDPKENVMGAAVKVFAERGFRTATVRGGDGDRPC